jgi:nicotinamidase-related amidase
MTTGDTALLVIDVQQKLLGLIPRADVLVRNIAFLIDGTRLLDMPTLATEQYPRGLGPTAPALAQRLTERPDKVAFSCCAVSSVVQGLERGGRRKVVLAGIETHVCVLQTALDLLAGDYRVYIVVDAVASRYPIDHEVALRRLERAGAVLTTTETCLFEWVGGADHPQFKKVSALVQERMKGLSAGERPLGQHVLGEAGGPAPGAEVREAKGV